MRILLVVTTLKPQSGWGTYGRNTARALQKKGHTVFALVQEKAEEHLCEQNESLPDPLSLLSSPRAWLQTAVALQKAVRRYKPNIIHVLVEPYALAVPFSRTTVRTPWVLSLNGTYSVLPLYHWHTRPLLHRAYRSANYIFSPSDYTAKRTLAALSEQCGKRSASAIRKKIVRFKLGIEPPATERVHQKQREKQFLSVGGIKPRKGIAETIQACASFRKQSNLPFHLHLVGTYPDDAYRKELQELIRTENLHANITFHGHIEENALEGLYTQTDLFIMLSKSFGHHFEGFGLVFLEANIRGIPVIGSKDSGCAEAIQEGNSGYATDPMEPDQVARRMRKIVEEDCIRSEDCRRWAQKHSVEQQATTFEETYKRALSNSETA